AQPLPQVELVRSLVDQDAAALAAPGRAPCRLVVVALRAPPGGDDPGGVAQLPELAGVDQGLQVGVHGVRALVEHDREGRLGMGGREGVHLLDLLRVHPGRLLGEGVDALADRGDRHLRVQVVRHSGHHRVDIAGIEHGDVVVVEGGARVLLGGDVLLGRVGVGDGAECHPLDLAVGEDAGVRPALGAESDDPEADVLLRHGVSVLWWVLAPRRARWMRWADVQEGGPQWWPARGGPPGVGSASTLLARTRRGPPARGGVSGVRSPPAAAACVSDSGYQNVIVVLLVARPHLARASAVRTEARPCVLTAGRADGWAGSPSLARGARAT